MSSKSPYAELRELTRQLQKRQRVAKATLADPCSTFESRLKAQSRLSVINRTVEKLRAVEKRLEESKR